MGRKIPAQPESKFDLARPKISHSAAQPDSARGMKTVTSHMALALLLCTVGAGQVQ